MTPQEYFHEAIRLYETGRPIDAQETMDKAYENHSIPAASYLGGVAFDHEDYKKAREYFEKALEWYGNLGIPSRLEDVQYAGMAFFELGRICFYGLDGEEPDTQLGSAYIILSHVECSYPQARELAGLMYYDGYFPDEDEKEGNEEEEALTIWEEGMEHGDKGCTYRWCAAKVEKGEADASVIEKLKNLCTASQSPVADAAAVLYEYYMEEGNEEEAWKWRRKAEEMESSLMFSIIDDEVANSDEPDVEFQGYDDETEAPAPKQ